MKTSEEKYLKAYAMYEKKYEQWINGEISDKSWEKYENELFALQEEYDKKIEK